MSRRERLRPLFLYKIRTYCEEDFPSVVDKEFTFYFEKPFNVVGRDLALVIHPANPHVNDNQRISQRYRSFGSSNVKFYVLRGRYKDLHGVILKSLGLIR